MARLKLRRTLAGYATLRGLVVPELGTQPVPWRRVSLRTPNKQTSCVNFTIADETNRPLFLNDRPIFVSVRHCPRPKWMLQKLKQREYARAFRDGTLDAKFDFRPQKRAEKTLAAFFFLLMILGPVMMAISVPHSRDVLPALAVLSAVVVGGWVGLETGGLIAGQPKGHLECRQLRVTSAAMEWVKPNGNRVVRPWADMTGRELDEVPMPRWMEAQYVILACKRCLRGTGNPSPTGSVRSTVVQAVISVVWWLTCSIVPMLLVAWLWEPQLLKELSSILSRFVSMGFLNAAALLLGGVLYIAVIGLLLRGLERMKVRTAKRLHSARLATDRSRRHQERLERAP